MATGVVSWFAPPLLLFEVVAIRFALIVGQAFPACDPAVADDARLQICDQSVDLIEVERARCRLQIVRLGAQWPPVACADRICARVEGGHAGARSPATDRLLDPDAIQPRRAQIGSLRIVIIVAVAVRKRTVAIHASGASPGLQPGPYPG